MGGANLEVWKFGFYTLFPLATLYYFSDDDWYNKHVVPYGKRIWPEYEKTNRPPHTQQEIQAELARLKNLRQAGVDPTAGSTSGATMSHEMRSAASTGIFTSSETERQNTAEVQAATPVRPDERIVEHVGSGGVQDWRQADVKRLV